MPFLIFVTEIVPQASQQSGLQPTVPLQVLSPW